MKKWFYKAGIGIAGVLFAASTMILFAPKTVHALASALVTVANTAENPVPTQSVDNPALQSFEAEGFCTFSGEDCTAEVFSVPIGMTAVVQDVSGDCNTPGPLPDRIILTKFNILPVSPEANLGRIELTPVFENQDEYAFGRQATLYASTSPGPAALEFSARVTTILQTGGTCNVFVSGYLVKNAQ